MDTVITIKNLNNEDEDELPTYEYDSTDSKSTSKRFPLVNNFKSAKDEVEKDIRNIFNALKESFLNK